MGKNGEERGPRGADGRADNPGVIARPPLVYLGGLAMGLFLDWWWPVGLSSSVYHIIVGLTALAAGLALFIAGIRAFNKAGTPFKPTRPTTRIITTGPFRYTRNPLYVSITLVYIGIALLTDGFWLLAMLVPVLAVIRYGVIAREERYLESKFGEEYQAYRSAVRRWI